MIDLLRISISFFWKSLFAVKNLCSSSYPKPSTRVFSILRIQKLVCYYIINENPTQDRSDVVISP